MVARLHLAAAHRVCAHGQWLNQSRYLGIHRFRHFEQIFNRYGNIFGNAALNMHTKNLKTGTAVLAVLTAGHTMAAGNVGEHTHLVANLECAAVAVDLIDHAAQLVAKYARIGQQQGIALIGVNVAAADADRQHLDAGVAVGDLRKRHILQIDLKGLLQHKCFHGFLAHICHLFSLSLVACRK